MTRWFCSFVALWLCLSFVHQSRFDGATPASRLDLLFAIVVDGTLAIDRYHENTPDKAIHRGVYYSDKAPGTVLLALPAFGLAYAIERQLGRSEADRPTWLACSWAACAFSQALPAAVGGMLLLAWLQRHATGEAAVISVLGLWLGSLPLPYSTMLFSHAQVVGLLSIAIWALDLFADSRRPAGGKLALTPSQGGTLPESPQERGLQSAGVRTGQGMSLWAQARAPQRFMAPEEVRKERVVSPDPLPGRADTPRPPPAQFLGRPRYALAGVCLGLASASEYTAGLVVLALGFHALTTRHSRSLAAFFLGFVPPVLLIPGYSWLTIGTPLGLPYSHQASFPEMSRGLYAIQWPDPANLARLLFGPTRGLVYWTPFLLLAPLGWWISYRRHPQQLWLTYAVPLLHVVLISGRTWDWQAGYTLSARYLAPVLPLLALPCALGAERLPRLARVLATVSILLIGLATVTDACPVYDIRNPLTELHASRLLERAFSPNLATQVLGVPPLAGLLAFGGCILLAIAGMLRIGVDDRHQRFARPLSKVKPGPGHLAGAA